MTKAQIFARRHSSTILTFLGTVGVVATSVLAVKATPKALELIEDEKDRQCEELLKEAMAKGLDNCAQISKLKPIEIIKVAWKPYIPAIITGASTIACILGANYLSTRSQASLMSAYALLDNSYKEYRKRTKDLIPEESNKIEHDIIKSKYNPGITLHNGKELFYDMESMRYFESTLNDVKRAEELLNQKLTTHGYACLNDFYDILGIPHTPYGYQLGWSTMSSDRIYAYSEVLLEFDYDKGTLDDGMEFTIVSINYSPEIEYIS